MTNKVYGYTYHIPNNLPNNYISLFARTIFHTTHHQVVSRWIIASHNNIFTKLDQYGVFLYRGHALTIFSLCIWRYIYIMIPNKILSLQFLKEIGLHEVKLHQNNKVISSLFRTTFFGGKWWKTSRKQRGWVGYFQLHIKYNVHNLCCQQQTNHDDSSFVTPPPLLFQK